LNIRNYLTHKDLQELDLSALNRAAHLIDGTQLLVPSRNRFGRLEPADSEYRMYGTRASLPSSPRLQPAGGPSLRIQINQASAAELQSLPGIGPVKAQAIISYRQQHPFRRNEDLMQVRGIGPKTFEQLRDRITVGP